MWKKFVKLFGFLVETEIIYAFMWLYLFGVVFIYKWLN